VVEWSYCLRVAYCDKGENRKGGCKITHLEEAFGNIDLKAAKGMCIKEKKYNGHQVRLR
jgi:hypothetical protein